MKKGCVNTLWAKKLIKVLNKGNPSSIYKIFKEVGAGKGLRKQAAATSIKVGDTLIEDPTDMANEFNNFFVNIHKP